MTYRNQSESLNWLGQWKESGLAGQLLRGGAGSLVAKMAEVLLGLAVVVLLARMLGPAGYGVYAFVFALVSVVSVPVRMGLPSLVVRETARGLSRGDWAVVRGVWRWANGVVVLLSLFVACVGMLGLLVGWAEGEPLKQTLPWGIALIPVMALGAIRAASLRGLRRTLAGVFPDQVLRPAVLVFLLAVATVWPGMRLSPAGAMVLMLVSSLTAFFVGALLLRRYRPTAVRKFQPVYHHRTWAKSSLPMAFTEGTEQFLRHADVLMLGLMAATVDVGVYRVAAQGALVVSLALFALNMVAAPFFAELHAQDDHDKLQKLATRLAQVAFGLALPVFLTFSLFGDWILVTFFGKDYISAWWPLVILSLGQVLSAGFGSTGILLNMTGHEREVSRAVGAAAVVNVLLNLLLIPPFGVIGAALATSVSLAFWKIWLWLMTKRRLGIRSFVI